MTEPVPMNPKERRHAEAVLLGSLFLRPDAGVVLRDQLQPEDFSEKPHRLIYEALTTVWDSPELVTVDAMSTLLTPDELAEAGGLPYLAFLLQLAESTTIPIEDQVQLLKRGTLHAPLYRATGALPVFTGIPTGFADLDTVTGGLQRSDLVIVAGPPSIGKTSFALSIALHVLLAEHCSVGLFSLEVPTRQVISRLLAMEPGLDEQLLRSVEVEEGEWQRPSEESAASLMASLWIDDTANLSTAELSDKAHLLAERAGIQFLIVDYIHLMLSRVNDKRHENRVQEVGEISRSLKALARELDLPVLVLAQVSRAFEGRPSKQLQLSDLRDGSLENDADLVLFLSVSEADTPASAGNPRLATISIAMDHAPTWTSVTCPLLPASATCRYSRRRQPLNGHQPPRCLRANGRKTFLASRRSWRGSTRVDESRPKQGLFLPSHKLRAAGHSPSGQYWRTRKRNKRNSAHRGGTARQGRQVDNLLPGALDPLRQPLGAHVLHP